MSILRLTGETYMVLLLVRKALPAAASTYTGAGYVNFKNYSRVMMVQRNSPYSLIFCVFLHVQNQNRQNKPRKDFAGEHKSPDR